MCSSKSKASDINVNSSPATAAVSDVNGRPVLQPAVSNRVPATPSLLERRSLKKSLSLPKSLTPPPSAKTNQPPISPKLKSPRQAAVKRSGNNHHDAAAAAAMNSSSDRLVLPLPTKCTTPRPMIPVKKPKKCSGDHDDRDTVTAAGTSTSPNSLVVKYSSAAIVEAPGSIAAARREQVAVMQVQRKMRIAHYGRSKSAKFDSPNKLTSYFDPNSITVREDKRCSFITPNSDPIYVAYHDEEWGVPAHDDRVLFELLVLTGAQVGSDWTSVLKKRLHFREAFCGFDAEIVAKFSEKKITSVSGDYGIDTSLVRGVVDNSNSILQIIKTFGSFDKYIWGFVNHKPIVTQYKSTQKMPVKTSKSEAISKDMVRRGFRQVGPTVVHSFMQAAGLTNDHLTTCPRHLQCLALAL